MRIRIRTLTVLVAGLCLAAAPGCKKDEPAPEGAPPQQQGGPSGGGPDQPQRPGPATPQPAVGGPVTDNATGAATNKPVTPPVAAPVVKSQLDRPAAPPVPTDNLLLVIRAAETGCRADQPICPAREALAAKLTEDLDMVTELLAKGTDQQRIQIRLAVQRSGAPETDGLLATVLVGRDGLLDRVSLAHAVMLRAGATVKTLLGYLNKAQGDEAVLSIDALAAIGGDEAVSGLVTALDNAKLAPYFGEICRALSRSGRAESLDKILAVATRLNATQRQTVGCRGAEAAIRMQKSLGPLSYNIDGARKKVATALVHQTSLHTLRVSLSLDAGADCASPGTADAVFSIPLARTGAPIVDAGVAASLAFQGKDLGPTGSFLMHFDALKLEAGTAVSGAIHHSHAVKSDPHIVISGRFTGSYCGVAR
jgi:hypothetical protein